MDPSADEVVEFLSSRLSFEKYLSAALGGTAPMPAPPALSVLVFIVEPGGESCSIALEVVVLGMAERKNKIKYIILCVLRINSSIE
jgi:hypothetical protein